MDTKLLEEYNKLIVRYKMALIYIDSKEIQDTEKQKFIAPFQNLTCQLDKILKEIKSKNIQYTDNEVIEGFHVEFRIARYEKYKY